MEVGESVPGHGWWGGAGGRGVVLLQWGNITKQTFYPKDLDIHKGNRQNNFIELALYRMYLKITGNLIDFKERK